MSNPLKEWIGRPLDKCKIEICIEVYRVDENGKRVEGISAYYFKDVALAGVYRSQLVDSSSYKIRQVFVLGNDYTGILLDDPVRMQNIQFVNQDVLCGIRRKVLGKLSEDERTILGLT